MTKVIFVKGIQASGKSTWAKDFVKENQDYKRVSRDDLRHMVSSYTFNGKNEKLVTELERSIMHSIIAGGYNMVIDKMNLNQKDFEDDKNYLMHVGALNNINLEFEVKDFPVTLAEAIKRDKGREFVIGEKVLRATWSKYQEELIKMLNIPKVEYNPELRNAVIFDIDGTLALRGNRNPFDFSRVKEDEVNEPIKRLAHLLKYSDPCDAHQPLLIIFSGRDDSCEQQTREWLKENSIQFDQLYMRKTGDKRKDSIVKRELYEAHIKNKYNILYVVDDRRQVIDMWRNELGLCCLDCQGHDF